MRTWRDESGHLVIDEAQTFTVEQLSNIMRVMCKYALTQNRTNHDPGDEDVKR